VSSPNKTQPTKNSVNQFIAKIQDLQKLEDARVLIDLMTKLTGEKPVLWGSIIGFGSYHYKFESGREGDWMRIGFSPRKNDITIYIIPGYADLEDKIAELGKHKIGKSCLYIKNLADVDMSVLQEIIQFGIDCMDQKYPKISNL